MWLAGLVFRYQGARSAPSARRWPPIVAELRHDCELSNTGELTLSALGGRWTVPCTRLRF